VVRNSTARASSYIVAVHRFVVIALAFAACGGSTAEVQHPVIAGVPPRPNVAGAGVAKAPPAPAHAAVVPDIGCLATTCAFHAGAAAYFTCLSGGAGVCFHFGAPCAPADGCMFDPGDRTYKQCATPVEGTCRSWGAACAPRSGCMFDPADGLHHHCDDVAGGTCKRYGALCAP
jgi:hypothetical protein